MNQRRSSHGWLPYQSNDTLVAGGRTSVRTRDMLSKLNQRMLFGIVSGWGSQLFSLCLGLFTYPLFFRYLPHEELAVWLFFLGTSVFINLADFGFSPVLGRHLAFELGKGDRTASQNIEGAAHFFSLARHVSSFTAAFLFLILLGVGGFFLYLMDLPETLLKPAFLGWVVYTLSQAVSCHFRYLETTLNGYGEVGWQNLLQVVVQVLALLGYFTVLTLNLGGILALATVFLARSLLLAGGFRLLVAWRLSPGVIQPVKVAWSDLKPHIRPALDLFLITLGAFLILNTNQYFIVLFIGADALPDYSAACRLIQVVYTFATTASLICTPFISRLSASGQIQSVHKLLMVNTTVGMLIQLAGVCMIAVFGDYLLAFWIGPGHFVGWPIIWVLCLLFTLENHHVIFARFGMNFRTDPSWGKVSVIAGLLNLILSYVGGCCLGLLGIAMATMVTQMLTNNWYAIWKTLRIVGLKFSDYIRNSGSVWLPSGCLLLALLTIIRYLIMPPLVAVGMAVMATAALFSSILYQYARKNKAALV